MTKQASPTIAQKMEQLQVLLDWFDGDDFELEQATERFRAIETLAGEIDGDLEGLKNEIRVVARSFDEE